ncbi:MAG: hypothetical protein R3C09_20335 [Pirellulaceae bacterium]
MHFDARLPKLKTLQEYDFEFPKRISKQKLLRLFDFSIRRDVRVRRADWADGREGSRIY